MKALIAFGASAALFLLLFVASCRTVPTGSVGVHTHFGRASEVQLEPGLHFIVPLVDSIVRMDTQLKSFEVDSESSSHDLQKVKTVISVQHSLDGSLASKCYAKVGNMDQFDNNIVAKAVYESMKAVTAQYTAEELITKRNAVKAAIAKDVQEFIDQTLADRDIAGAVTIANVAIQDFDFSDEFNRSIEGKVKAQQEALRAENEKQRRTTDAEAKKKEVELAADAEAYEIEKISSMRAAAIKREAEALAANPHVLQLRAIEKWDGTVPKVSGGQMVPFLNITDLGK